MKISFHLPLSFFLTMTSMSLCHAGEYADAVLADQPVTYWQFSESDVAEEATNSGLLGDTAKGFYTESVGLGTQSLVTGEADTSARFTTGGRMITEPFDKFDSVNNVGGTGFSVEFWMQYAAVPSTFVNLVGDGEGGLDFNLMVYGMAGGGIRPHLQTDFGFASLDSERQIKTGEIVHVVSTWDIDSGDFLLYLDGEEADVNVSAGFGPPFEGEPLNFDNVVYLGKDDREPSPEVWLDEVAIYNYALDPQRVKAHFDLGKGMDPITGPTVNIEPNVNISLSTDVVGPGTFANGHSNQSGTLEIIRQVPNSADANIVAYTSDENGPTIDVGEFIVDGGTAGGFGSNTHGRGGNLWVPGDGESNVPHEGFGGHANWIATFDVEKIRSEHLADAEGDLRLTGRYGSWGNIGDTTEPAGVTQGAVYVDGVRADAMDETAHNVPAVGGVESPSQEFDIVIPAGAKHVTLALLSGPGSTFWDDGVFRNVRLRVADPVLDAQDGLVSFWNFDESNSGLDRALDQPGGNTGTFLGTAERTDGLVGDGAARFNDTAGDSVTVGPGNDNSFSFDTGITIEALIQSEWLGGNYDEIFRKEDGGNRILLSFQDDPNNGGANPPVDPGPVLSFGLNIDGYGELDMPLDGEDGRPTVDDLSDGSIRHIVATYDSESGEKAIWIDGEKLWDVEFDPGTLMVSGGDALAQIGNVGAGEPFSGVIDELAIWNRALSADEIASHFQNVMNGGNYFGLATDPCDFDGDGSFTVNDIDLLSPEIQSGANRSQFDVNSDGLVNQADLVQFVTDPAKLNTYIGDTDLDGEFNSGDLVRVFEAGKFETQTPASWSEGDWNGDGVFSSGDLVLAFQDGGFEKGPRAAAVPEPATTSLLLLVITLLTGYRLRKV